MHRLQHLHKHLGGDCNPGGKILSTLASRCLSSVLENYYAFAGGGRQFSRELPLPFRCLRDRATAFARANDCRLASAYTALIIHVCTDQRLSCCRTGPDQA